MSSQNSLIEKVAQKTKFSEVQVEQAFREHGVALSVAHRNPRHLRLHRLRVRGTKRGKVEPGPIDETFNFPSGVTVISAGNFRGKTSILETISLVLRGEPKDLQSDALGWFSNISLDVSINGNPVGFRLVMERGTIAHGTILTGSVDALKSSDDTGVPETSVITSSDDAHEWPDIVSAFMLDRLSLDEIVAFNKAKKDTEVGIIKSHGWPTYFSTLYPPSGAERVLLGSTAVDGVPVRLLQVFLDRPDAIRTARVGALAKRIKSEYSAADSKRRASERALQEQTDQARKTLEEAERLLDELSKVDIEDDLTSLSQQAKDLGAQYISLRLFTETVRESSAHARSARISDERALLSLQESSAAHAIFHGLDPAACPRCEHPIEETKKQREHDAQLCSVCDSRLEEIDPAELDEIENQARESLNASVAAEKALRVALQNAEEDLSTAEKNLHKIDALIVSADAARSIGERSVAEMNLLKAQTVLETLQSISGEKPEIPPNQIIFEAAESILKEELKDSGKSLYEDLNDEVLKLGKSFGILELENIIVKPQQLHMDVTKGGGTTSSFSSQSPGERLRLRYALVISLLRVARRHNIAGHPGLLLLDSIKAEEVQVDHARTLLEGLVKATLDEPELQILVTTEDRNLAGSVSGVAATIQPQSGRTSLF